MKICRKCSMGRSDEHDFCWVCGDKLADGDSICECGYIFHPCDKFCPVCGEVKSDKSDHR